MTSPQRPPTGPSGAPLLPGQPLRLGHLVPERLPVVVTRTNPDWLMLTEGDPRRDQIPELADVVLQGYVFGPRCPGVVKAELASIEEAYMTALNASAAAQEEGGGTESQSGTGVFITAWHTFLRETIQALVPGMTSAEADVLASVAPGMEGAATELLRYLGLWTPAAPTADGGAPPDPEAVGGESPSITEPSSPISSSSTESLPAPS